MKLRYEMLLLMMTGTVFLTSCVDAKEPAVKTDFEKLRREMVERQLVAERRGIKNERVLQAMAKVPRHEFVPADRRGMAYRDSALPIGHEQTISQPYIVAFMTEKLDPQADERVLEIGTGSGYQAAVLGELAKEVYSIEIVVPLAARAAKTLKRLGYENVKTKAGDGYKGWAEHAPFDAVIVTCAPDHIPALLVAQLREGGRMIIPVGEKGGVQELVLLKKEEGKIVRKSVLPVRFVPMTGESEKRTGKE